MAPLLRKAKSTVHDAASSPKPIDPSNNSTVQRHHRLQKTQAQDPSARILDQDSNLNKRSRTPALSQRLQSSDHPLTEFRRRLARKASTLTLRTKIRQGGFQSRGRDQGQNEAKEEKKRKERELLPLGGEEVVQQFRQQRDEVGRDQVQVLELPSHRSIRSLSHSSVTTAIPAATAKTPDTVTTPTPFVKDFPSREQTSDPRESSISLQELIRKEQASHISKDVQVGKILVKNDNMASELAAPPVPYTRLKEITEKVSRSRPIGRRGLIRPGSGIAMQLLTTSITHPGMRSRPHGRNRILPPGYRDVEYHDHQQHIGRIGRGDCSKTHFGHVSNPATVQIRC